MKELLYHLKYLEINIPLIKNHNAKIKKPDNLRYLVFVIYKRTNYSLPSQQYVQSLSLSIPTASSISSSLLN